MASLATFMRAHQSYVLFAVGVSAVDLVLCPNSYGAQGVGYLEVCVQFSSGWLVSIVNVLIKRLCGVPRSLHTATNKPPNT